MKRVSHTSAVISKKPYNIRFLARRISALAFAAAGTLAFAALPARAQTWPAGIVAEYEVNYNGFNVGSFAFKAQAEQQNYMLTGNASLSMLLGIVSWTGDIRTFGSIGSNAPKPVTYAFDAKSGSRSAAVRIGFDGGAATSVARIPQLPPKPDTVPLREQHLQGVVDPLSAMMVVTQGSTPCERRIPIFDGRERFDLVLTKKGETRVTEQQPSGQPGVAHVCKVRYVPIAGHTPDSDTRFMAANDGIEVVLRPIPSAKLYVPYQITIPMPLGSATLVSKRVEITQAGKPRIALLH